MEKNGARYFSGQYIHYEYQVPQAQASEEKLI
jgi:hypothetical protein